MSDTKSSSFVWRTLGMLICATVLGLPAALVFTHGTILVPLLVMVVLAPFVILHYLLWGWWLSPRPQRNVTTED